MYLKKIFSRTWLFTTVLVIVGSLVCVRLGIWQLDRLNQRISFNNHYLEVIKMPTLQLPVEDVINLEEMEYRKVEVTGNYDFENQVALRNRYYKIEGISQPGYHLITPLILEDGTAVMIERGWIPYAGNESPEQWRAYDETGLVIISGILRLGQTQAELGGVPDSTLMPGQTSLKFWNLINLERISSQVPYPLLPVFIQPNVDEKKTNPPYPFQPEVEISEGPHMGYALQWFAFAAILFFGYPIYLAKQQETEN